MLLLLALLNGFEDPFFMKRQRAPMVFGTLLPNRTWLAVRRLELDAGEIVETAMVTHGPGITDFALWTNRHVVFPINAEGIDFKASGLLPGMFFDQWAD